MQVLLSFQALSSWQIKTLGKLINAKVWHAAHKADQEGQVTLSSPMRGIVFRKNSAVHTMSASKTHSSCRVTDGGLLARQPCITADRRRLQLQGNRWRAVGKAAWHHC